MMNENERSELEQEVPEFSLDDILKEFGADEEHEVRQSSADELLEAVMAEAGVRLVPEQEEQTPDSSTVSFEPVQQPTSAEEPRLEQTIRVGQVTVNSGDTQRLDPLQEDLGDTQRIGPVTDQLEDTHVIGGEDLEILRKAAPQEEPFSEKWEPEYDQPIGEYVPPQPIVFHPRSRLRELKRKLVAGPEKRYYELTEIGLGRLQVAIFLSLVVVLLSAGALALYTFGMVRADRMKLMVLRQASLRFTHSKIPGSWESE